MYMPGLLFFMQPDFNNLLKYYWIITGIITGYERSKRRTMIIYVK